MSWHIEQLVRARVCGSAQRKAVLMSLANRANDDGSDVWVSKVRIAAETELARSTVVSVIQGLEAEGVLRAVGKRSGRRGYTVIYHMSVAKIAAFPTAWDKCLNTDTMDADLGEDEEEPAKVSAPATVSISKVSARQTVSSSIVSESPPHSVRPAVMTLSLLKHPDDHPREIYSQGLKKKVEQWARGTIPAKADGFEKIEELLAGDSPCTEADIEAGMLQASSWLIANRKRSKSFRYFCKSILQARDARLNPAPERAATGGDELDRMLAKSRGRAVPKNGPDELDRLLAASRRRSVRA